MRRPEVSKSGAPVWRRGGAPGGAAPTPTGAEASPASRRGRSQGSAKAGLANPLAPPGAPLPTPKGEGERKRGEGRARVHKNGACGALAFFVRPSPKPQANHNQYLANYRKCRPESRP